MFPPSVTVTLSTRKSRMSAPAPSASPKRLLFAERDFLCPPVDCTHRFGLELEDDVYHMKGGSFITDHCQIKPNIWTILIVCLCFHTVRSLDQFNR
jgi:hypothetical protein